jgi:L-aminopeptidase/D-esterase-like protein
MGIARLGSSGEHYSGDIFIAFSTANPQVFRRTGVAAAHLLANDQMTPLFAATVQSVEEAVLNALVAAHTLTGINGTTAHALPHDRPRRLFPNHLSPITDH